MPGPLELYEELKPKLGEKEARDLLEYVREAIEKGAATKEEIHRLEAAIDRKIDTVKNELLLEMASVKNELLQQIVSVKSELQKEMLGHLRWLFAFWITIIATVILKDLLR